MIVNIILNGRPQEVFDDPEFDYTAALTLTGNDRNKVMTVTWSKPCGCSGILTKGTSVPAVNGMVVNVMDTSNA